MTKEKIINAIMGILTTGMFSALGWAWSLSSQVAVLENKILNVENAMLKDDNSKETANTVLKDWSSIKSTQESHGRQLQNLWKHLNSAQEKEIKWENRVSRIETIQERCCD